MKLSIAVQSTQGEVLAVPVNALSVGADGRERVQVDRGWGRTELVFVRTGLRAQGFVEVSPRNAGELKAGDLVVVGSARRRRGGEGPDRIRRAGDARRREHDAERGAGVGSGAANGGAAHGGGGGSDATATTPDDARPSHRRRRRRPSRSAEQRRREGTFRGP